MGVHKGQVSKRIREMHKQRRRERLKRDAEVTEKYGQKGHRACGRKRRYPDEATALAKADLSMIYGAPKLSVYKCPYCGGWHLTSKG